MPRFTARNAVVLFNILLISALIIHLKYELWDKHSADTDLAGVSHLPDEQSEEHDTSATLSGDQSKGLKANSGVKERRTAVVVASRGSENATWLKEYFPHWEMNHYRLDDPDSRLKVPENKGRESMVYLTYIIDHYNALPDNILFVHPNRYQWHNDDPDYDGLPMLRHFQIPYLEQEGYVNIRCAWSLGCPSEIKPFREAGEHREAVHAGGDYKLAFQQLFPGEPVPETVGVSCCAQFAATKEQIRKRKRGEYIRYREWILNTSLKDSISGRVFEYSWHMIFGKKPVHCPRAKDCYCKVFGLCGLSCSDEGSCDGRYVLPPFSSLPNGWPMIGWDGQPRQRAGSEE